MIRQVKKLFRSAGFDIVKSNKNKLSNRDLFEHDVKVFIKNSNPVIFDVGANKGQSIDFYKELFPSASIYSFEPNQKLYNDLKEKYGGKDIVQVFPCALGEHVQHKEFIIYENNELSSFKPIEISSQNPFVNEKVSEKDQVEVDTLDQFLFKRNIKHIDLLKIDTQGYELEVLKGATASLDRGIINNIYLELNLINMYEGQSNYIDILNFLHQKRFQLCGFYELNRPDLFIKWTNAFFRRVDA